MSSLELGVIGNCAIAALVDRRGRIVWYCHPRLDGDPVFCSLIDGDDEQRGGFFDLSVENTVSSRQYYARNSAVLITELDDDSGGKLRITDFAPRFKQFGRIFRPATIVRRVEPTAGRPRLRIRVRPRFANGAAHPEITRGSNHLRYVGREQTLRLTTDAPIAYVVDETPFLLEGPLDFILGPDESLTRSILDTAREFLESTDDYWREWSRYLSVPLEWQEAVIRAAITLKLCSFEETGAVLAALTTSIPEAPDSGRNWDYRYCWLRDSYFVVRALNRLSATLTMENYLGFIGNVIAQSRGAPLRPAYGITLGAEVEEHRADSLAGYRSMGPVRVGNQACTQIQHDVYGSVVLASTQAFFDHRLAKPGDISLFQRLEPLGEQAIIASAEPDAGLWEYRGRARLHTHSMAMCWAACDALARIALRLGLNDRAAYWRGHADTIHARTVAHAWDPGQNSFVESRESRDIDAALLLLGEIGFVSANDPRFAGTVAAVERKLRRGDYLLRYHARDDFGEPEMAFTVCSFWYVNALARLGRKDEARALFEALLARRNHLGLLSEDLDPKSGTLWGNFPQTYSMVGIIDSALRLSKPWEDAV